jgi:hypothetical protein
MNLPVIFLLYRLFKAEYFIMKAGYYLVEWVGARQLGRVVTKQSTRSMSARRIEAAR